MIKKLQKPLLLCIVLFIMLGLIFTTATTLIPQQHTANAATDSIVYLGGTPIGISAKSDKLIINELVSVTTADGTFSPSLKAGLAKGDVIHTVCGREVENIVQLNDLIKNAKGDISVIIERAGEKFEFTIKPVFDIVQNAQKIGLMVKNELAGVGTLTFVTKNNGYGALGHMIADGFGIGSLYQKGNVYKCNIGGVVLPTENKAGGLRGTIDFTAPIGTIISNGFSGIYGQMEQNIGSDMPEIEIASQSEIKMGKAQIRTTISGSNPEYYDIEIVKINKQGEAKEKGLVIKITDKELKNKTHGILQGMSGSPIIQNGKLVGAVTHVFTADATKGYGIFAEWMKQKVN